MISLPFSVYDADQVELELASAERAHQLLDAHLPDAKRQLIALARGCRLNDDREMTAVIDALVIAHARMATRNGCLSARPLEYHNDQHAIDLVWRLQRMRDAADCDEMDGQSLLTLILFATMHDLRQDEQQREGDVGANELASIAEARRILAACGLDLQRWFDPLKWMIAGSTFAVPSTRHHIEGGALASRLMTDLARELPDDQLNLLAWGADIDTASVADPFPAFARSAVALCSEREYRLGREMGTDSAVSVLQFLTDAQWQFFFTLHRFHSPLALRTFGPDKQANAHLLKTLISSVKQATEEKALDRGDSIAEVFVVLADDLAS
ncbi:MAG: hypothetical protein DHS20C11_33490 [Lysobacteraceae bacterium]|nr:MAG: hypothetical protein DHS20C11_33490 [Xanthomonadaceae bacterium]